METICKHKVKKAMNRNSQCDSMKQILYHIIQIYVWCAENAEKPGKVVKEEKQGSEEETQPPFG